MSESRLQQGVRIVVVTLAYLAVGLAAHEWAPLVSRGLHALLFTAMATGVLLAFTIFGVQALGRLKDVDAELMKYPARRPERATRYVHGIRTRLTAWTKAAIAAFVVLIVVAGVVGKDHGSALLYVIGYVACLTVVFAAARIASAYLGVSEFATRLRRTLDQEEHRAKALAASKTRLPELTEATEVFTLVPPR
jgi:hypothetical protein